MCYPGETDTPQCTNHHGTSIKKKWNKKKRHHCTRVGKGPKSCWSPKRMRTWRHMETRLDRKGPKHLPRGEVPHYVRVADRNNIGPGSRSDADFGDEWHSSSWDCANTHRCPCSWFVTRTEVWGMDVMMTFTRGMTRKIAHEWSFTEFMGALGWAAGFLRGIKAKFLGGAVILGLNRYWSGLKAEAQEAIRLDGVLRYKGHFVAIPSAALFSGETPWPWWDAVTVSTSGAEISG